MNKEDKAIIDEWDGENDENHMITVTMPIEFENAVKQSPDVDNDDIMTPESEAERWGGEPEDYEIDGIQMSHSAPWFWCEIDRESLKEWVAEQLGLKVEWIDDVSVDG